MRTILFCLFFLPSFTAFSQDNTFTKYFDSLWAPASKSNAHFYTEFVKQGDVYKCTSYWKQSGKLFARSTYKDTLFEKPVGMLVRYYENGNAQDSIYYSNDGSRKELFHFYESGKVWAHCKQQGKREDCEGFDEKGNTINDFIYLLEAEFPGGNSEWSAYLGDALAKFNPGKKGAPVGTYKVIVNFIVDEKGKVSDVTAVTNFGYGMEDKAVEIIRKSPRWTPLIYLGKPTKAYRRQPLTFLVSAE